MTAPDEPLPPWAQLPTGSYPPSNSYPPMPPAPDEQSTSADGGWRKLDPRTILTYPFAQGAPLVFVVILAAAAGGAVRALLIRLVATVAALLVFGLLHWWRFRYRLVAGRLETRAGLLARRSKVINVDRIRGVEIEAKLAHRVAGVCALHVEHPGAAGGSRGRNRDGRDRIDAVSLAEGQRLRTLLLHERAIGPAAADGASVGAADLRPAPPTERVLLRMPARWLLYGPFSARLLLVAPAAVFGAFSSVNEAGVHTDRALGWAPSGTARTISLAVALVVLLVAAAGLTAMVRYWRWTVTARGDDVVLTGGLLTRRVSAIERRRLRGVVLREPLLGRPVAAATLHVVLSGVTGGVRSALVPLGPRPPLERFGATFVAPCTAALARHPRGALRRRLRRSMVPGVALLVVAGVVAVLDRPDSPDSVAVVLGVAAVLLVWLGVLWGRASYGTLGHAVDDRVLSTRRGVLVRHTETVERSAPIGLRVRQSIFARRAGVASVDVALVARGFTRISDLAETDVAPLARTLLPRLVLAPTERASAP